MTQSLFAFLGISDYLPCNYVFEFKDRIKISNIRFVQEAIASILSDKGNEELKVVLFVTEVAKQKTFFDNGHLDSKGRPLPREGLEKRLKLLGDKITINLVEIPEGISEQEICSIFNIVYNNIMDNDEIIFDITHAFRSLPMLAIIILGYAKILKNITIKGI